MAGKVVKQLAGNGSGQSLADRVNAAKFSLAGSGLGRGIIKATTEELVPPKKKHLDYLTNCTNEISVSLPELAELLVDRTQQTSWVVVLKSFITVHHLLNFGNEKFSQYMAARSNKIHLPNFVDKTSSIGFEMSQYIKVYSKYVNEKTVAYRLMAFDFCKIKRGRDDGVLRRMPLDKLMKTLPVLQGQLDVLLEFDSSTKDLSNQVLCNAFTLLYKDLIRLYASYNEGMINLIEQYFTMSRKSCREALALYKGFLERTEKVSKFVTVAEGAGVGDKAALGLQAVPPKVLQTLENHLANLEKRKKSESDDEDVKQQKNDKVDPKIKQDIAIAAEKAKKTAHVNDHPKSEPKTSEVKSSSGLEDLLGGRIDTGNSTNKTTEYKSDDPPVRTQLRRPEQKQSVAVTISRDEPVQSKRPGRSPSPARPPARPTNVPSRDASPARPAAPHHNATTPNKSDDQDLFLNLHNDASGRASPFSADEKPIADSDGSFWTSDLVNNAGKTPQDENGINFDAAFKDNDSLKNEASHEKDKVSSGAAANLLDLDLFGSNDTSTAKTTATDSTTEKTTTQKVPDLDDLFGFGSEDDNVGGSVLAPQAVVAPITPAAPVQTATATTPVIDKHDDLLGALNVGINKQSITTNPTTTSTTKAAQSKMSATNTAPTKPNAPNKGVLDDTLAELASSLGKKETKWNSNTKTQTLAGKTLDSMTPSSGPTINWSSQKSDKESGGATNENKSNTDELLNLFG